MASKTHTVTWKIITAGARKALQDLTKGTTAASDGLQEMADKTADTEDNLAKLDKEVKSGALYRDEVASRVDNALGTMVEFGASIKQVERAQALLNKVDLQYRAQAAKALEKLADESEDAELAMRNMAAAQRIAAATGRKVEDVAKDLGDQLRGQTRIAQAYRRTLYNIKGVLKPLGPLFKAGAVAGAALGAALSTVAVAGVNQFIERNKQMAKQVKSVKNAWDDFLYVLGGAIIGFDNISGKTDKLATSLKDLTKATSDNSEKIGAMVRDTLKLFLLLARGVSEVGVYIAGAFAAIGDVIRTGLAQPLSAMFLGLKEIQFQLGRITLKEWKEAQVIHASIMKQGFTFNPKWLERVQKFQGGMRATFEELNRLADSIGGGKAPTKLPPRIGAKAGKKRKPWEKVKLRGHLTVPTPAEFAAMRALDAERGPQDAGLVFTDKVKEKSAENTRALGVMQEAARRMGDAMRAAKEEAKAFAETADEAFAGLAEGSLRLMVSAFGDMVQQMVAGTFKVGQFSRALIGEFGNLFKQVGTGMILLGSGVDSIKAGITSPGALIGIGAGLVIVGSAMSGWAARGGGAGAGGGVASAVQSGFVHATDRMLNQQNALESLTVNLEVEGFKIATARAVQRSIEDQAIPALTG